jgi:hypothetical protein
MSMTASSRHFLLSSVTKLVKMRKWPRLLLRCRIHQKLGFPFQAPPLYLGRELGP